MMDILTKISARDYMRITFDLDLPSILHAELIEAARDARIHPELFAAECVESILASRKLPGVAKGRCGPRVGIMEAE